MHKIREKGWLGKIQCREAVLQWGNLHFLIVLCVNQLQGAQYQFLGKLATHNPHFHLSTSPLKWRFFYILPTPYFYIPHPLLLMNHIFSWKSKPKHTNEDIAYFFSRCKIFTNKTSKALIGSALWNESNILLRAFYKIVTKNSTLDVERGLNNTNSHFGESYSYQLLTHPLNL